MSETASRIAIIGAGPAALIAADRLSRDGHGVDIYEQMPSPARKFLMAGRGGLNLTHSEPKEAFLARYREARPNLAPAIEAFDADALRAFCGELGEDTFVGTSGRVFPMSLKASPLLRALLRRLQENGARLFTRHRWIGFSEDGGLAFATPDGKKTTGNPLASLFALGGASWARLGSDASWSGPFRALGIDIAPFRPANSGFLASWSPVFAGRFAGTPLKRIAITFGGQRIMGEAMITANGLEGGAIYALSAELRDAIGDRRSADLSIDLRPDVSEAELAKRLAAPRGRQTASTFLRKKAGLAPVAIGLLREAGPLPQDAGILARRIKAMLVTLTGTAPIDRAISSAGGIRFNEIDEDFMLLRRPGVFVAGEMLDWEAPTGGYLLQACFATGIAAARGIEKWIARA
ncbi:TIGR03862 family flavoprotein [Stappia sp. F7233]|uniref:TIGR03862 family flavoprotein n=1 Tax=Stappia albiluteola TaxID=2758565 RepID=A0A839AEQ4_9HYPH|nr:TIGR03862 family flavoprotein [Stappia albiluteola]MBA5778300.1 TIGR03862 family flavoprotein [Stappia albiluteola]